MARAGRSSAWSFLKRPRVDEEVDAELAFHVDMTMQMLIGGGLTPVEARAEAVRRFGDMAVVAAECRRYGRQRDQSRARAEYLGELRQDVAFAWRQLGRARGFAATAIVTLALGIGATAAVFSALYAVVLRPLPFTDADRVVQVSPMRRGGVEEIVSGAELSAVRAQRRAFAGVAGARTGGGFTLTGMGVPEVINGSAVTADYFRVLGVAPVIGRGLLDSDDLPGAPRVTLVSHRLWTQRFAADTSLVGRAIRLGDENHTVIGVMPPELDATGVQDDLWTPLQLSAEQLANNNGSYLHIFARLAPGVTRTQAADAAGAAIRAAAVRTGFDARNLGAVVQRYVDVLAGGTRERLLVLLGAAAFVLLIACVNVANLLLARGTVRARELAIRAALGAGRGRLVRQLLAESLVLSLGGAVIGVIVAYGLVKGIVALGPDRVPRLDQTTVNGVVLTFTFAVAVASSILVGLVPASRAASPALQSALRDGGRGTGGGAGRHNLRALLVVAEVALAMTLLTGSGLLIRTAWRLQHVDPGFDPAHVMTARILLPATRYGDAAQIVRTHEQIRAAAEQVPGVRRAALTSIVPLSHSSMTTGVTAEGRQLSGDDRVAVDIRYNSPGYFGTMGMVLLDGRDIARTDDADAPQVTVISASLARRLWPGERAVGKRIDGMRAGRTTPNFLTVIGVVGDVHDVALNVPFKPTLYMPFTQVPMAMWKPLGRSLVLVVRTSPAPESLLPSLRRAVATIDASLPLTDEETMERWLSASVATTRFNTMLLTMLGAIALALASVGVYSVVAYFVSQRTREIGVRMALGAAPGHIWRLVLSRGLRPIVWGALLGLALSLATARLLREQLYGVTTQDPVTLGAVAAMLFGVALLATVVPARRAMRVTPARALAAE